MHVRVQLELPRDARLVGILRSVASCILTDLGASRADIGDIQVALTEACANVIRHAPAAQEYRVELAVGDEICEVEVVDEGPGFAVSEPAQVQAADQESGRGIALMRALVDDLQWEQASNGTRVRLVKRFADWTPTRTEQTSAPAPAGSGYA